MSRYIPENLRLAVAKNANCRCLSQNKYYCTLCTTWATDWTD